MIEKQLPAWMVMHGDARSFLVFSFVIMMGHDVPDTSHENRPP